jgi:predicted TIM-barrel fold metal-dependent hydrolase
MLCLLGLGGPVYGEPEPFADIHIHFNWDQKEVTSAREVVERLRAHNTVLVQVSSTPTRLALELADAAGPWVLPYFSPYLTESHRSIWAFDENVVTQAEKGLASGRYKGIGELHMYPDFGFRRENKVFNGLLELAARYQVPFLIHTAASSHLFFAPVCQKYPQVRFLWAHAGNRLQPDAIDQLMQKCPNLWAEVSARDPWRYDSLTDSDNRLLPGWHELFIKYQDRFMTGTDPVWGSNDENRWVNADEAWDHYTQIIEWHRFWLKQLPPEVEEKIRLTNARNFFSRD